MRLLSLSLAAALLGPAVCLAQSDEWAAPPLLAAPDAPRAAPDQAQPTPPPPGTQPQSGYPYSPYGAAYQPQRPEQLPAEVGLMVSESAFGMLTAAGTALIPYFLLLKPMMLTSGAGMDPSVVTLIFALVFTAVPLSVSQTELSLANGSRYYFTESWPASLSGLGAQAAVLGLYYLVGGINSGGTGEALLLAGTVAFVPLVEMLFINLAKTPRGQGYGGFGGLVGFSPERGLSAGLPVISPLLGTSRLGRTVGLSVPLAAGQF